MARRLLVFALAFVVIAGPLAGDVCEAFCAEHSGHSAGQTGPASPHHDAAQAARPPAHHHHPDAAPAPPAEHARLMALPHGCGHMEATVSESRELTPGPITTTVVTMVRVAPLLARVLPAWHMDSRHGPPAPSRSTSPLRI